MGIGLLLLTGNVDAAFNYPANQDHFRQDSTFLYYFGLDHAGLAGVIDLDSGEDRIFGNDADLDTMIAKALSQGREIHFTPPYRGETMLEL